MQPSAPSLARRSSAVKNITGALASFLMAALFVALFAGLTRAGSIKVMVDQVKLIRLDRHGSEVIIGNPSIADVAVQSGKLLVLTGKSAGLTNLIVLDGSGGEVLNKQIFVSADQNQLVLLTKGANRETYTCSPDCNPVLMTGDDEKYFELLAKEIRNKIGLAQSAAEGTTTQ